MDVVFSQYISKSTVSFLSWNLTMKYLVLFCLSLFLSTAAFAAKEKKQAVQLNIAAGDVPGQITTIKAKILEKEYVEMTASGKAELNRQFDALLGGQLDPASSIAMQDAVNSILTKAYADSRLYCTSQPVMGTNRKERACMTMAQKRATYEGTQLDLQRNLIPGPAPLQNQ
jgi:hypothetical protein